LRYLLAVTAATALMAGPTMAQKATKASSVVQPETPLAEKALEAKNGIATVVVGKFDGSIKYDAQCGEERVACTVTLMPKLFAISDGSEILYSEVKNIQSGTLAEVECTPEKPIMPYIRQGKGFPCRAGSPAFYTFISHRTLQNQNVISSFVFKNLGSAVSFMLNSFAAVNSFNEVQ
jgi:hypothetical protein